MDSPPKRRVLFVCTGNACRSPMAEGLLRHLAGDRYESLSAGVQPAGFIHRLAVRALAEIGVDILRQRSKGVWEFLPREAARHEAPGTEGSGGLRSQPQGKESGPGAPISGGAASPAAGPRVSPVPHVVVTLCDHALSRCPAFPEGTGRIHWPVFDPILAEGNEDQRMVIFRGVRDEIRALIERAIAEGEFESPPASYVAETAKRRSGMDRLLGGLGGLLRGDVLRGGLGRGRGEGRDGGAGEPPEAPRADWAPWEDEEEDDDQGKDDDAQEAGEGREGKK